MAAIVEIPLERLSADEFAPFGQLIGPREGEPPVFEAVHLRSWRQRFEAAGSTELMFVHYRRQPLAFSAFERHFQVTQSFIALGGVASVMVVAAPTDPNDWDAVPAPEELRAFYVPGDVGLMLWRGTWHALTRFPASAGGAGFAFLTEAATQSELERQRADGTPPRLTQEIDYRARCGTSFEVVDPEALLPAATG